MVTMYMVSISCQQKKNTVLVEEIMDVIAFLKNNIKKFKIIENRFEYGKMYGQMHWHGLVKVNSNLRWSPFIQYGSLYSHNNTFHIDWQRVYNKQKTIKYITKDDNNIIKKLKTHYFNQTTQQYMLI